MDTADRRRRRLWTDSSASEEDEDDGDTPAHDEGGLLGGLTNEWDDPSSAPTTPSSFSSLTPVFAYTSPDCPTLCLRVLLQPSRGIAFQLWPASFLLCRYLDSPSIRSLLPSSRVLELGAGCGLVGMLATALGARVTLTDLPHVVPHLERNVQANAQLFSAAPDDPHAWTHASGGTVRIAALSWREEVRVRDVDMVVVADCVYWEELFEPLLRTLGALCGASTRVLLSQTPRRGKVEGRFFKRARRAFHVRVLERWKERDSDRQPITLYELTRRTKTADAELMAAATDR